MTVQKPAYAGSAATPILTMRTTNSVTLQAIDGYEYQMLPAGTDPARLMSTGWQDSPEFTGLDAGTVYDCYQRVKEAATVAASSPSAKLSVKTSTPPAERTLDGKNDGVWRFEGDFANLKSIWLENATGSRWDFML